MFSFCLENVLRQFLLLSDKFTEDSCIIRIKYGFSCINIGQVLKKMLKLRATEGFQYLPRDVTNITTMQLAG